MSAVPGGPDVMLAESVMFVVFMMSHSPPLITQRDAMMRHGELLMVVLCVDDTCCRLLSPLAAVS